MNISYLVTVHNETETLIKLLERLHDHLINDDEIIIIDDFSDSELTIEIINKFIQKAKNTSLYQHKLNKDYSDHKNFGIEKCSKDWVFQCDGDELPSETILFNIRDIISTNKNVELIYVPRINAFKGVTLEHAKRW